MPEKLYEDIVEKHLRIPGDFLAEHKVHINQRLKNAAAVTEVENGGLTVNCCMHLASSIVLRHGTHLRELFAQLQRNPEGPGMMIDHSTFVTVALLYYLLNSTPENEEERKIFHQLKERFDSLNWLIGRDGMKKLGIHAQTSH